MSKPDTKSLDYQRMEPWWALPDALIEGTQAMRCAEYLPQHEAESQQRYNARLKMTRLQNFYARTLGSLVGKLFADKVHADVSDQMADLLVDVDLCGNSLHVLARDLAHKALHKGGAYIYVDAQDIEAGNETDARAAGLRPYLVAYDLSDVHGVRYEVVNGSEVITQARIHRMVTEQVDEFTDESVAEMLVVEPERWRTFRMDKGEWALRRDEINRLGFVPLVPVSINPVAAHEYRPTLYSLAELNLEHFQIRSDQRNSLSVCSFPIPCASGYESGRDPTITFGPFNMLATGDPAGRFYYLESNGTAIEQGRKELEMIEDHMRLFGLQFEVKQNSTATGNALDAREANSPLQDWGMRLAGALENAIEMMARRMGLQEDATVEIKVAKPLDQAVVAEVDSLLKARMAGEITRAEFRRELKRRAVVSDDFEADAEIEDDADLGSVPAETPDNGLDAELIELLRAQAAA